MATYKLSDGIDFYLDVFKKISAIYTSYDKNEVNISEKISEIVIELKQKNDKKLVKEALVFIVSIFENYMSDDYNVVPEKNIPEPEKKIYKSILEKEFFGFDENFELSKVLELSTITEEQREIIISILRKEILN